MVARVSRPLCLALEWRTTCNVSARIPNKEMSLNSPILRHWLCGRRRQTAILAEGFLTFDSEVGVDFDGAGFAAALEVHAEY